MSSMKRSSSSEHLSDHSAWRPEAGHNGEHEQDLFVKLSLELDKAWSDAPKWANKKTTFSADLNRIVPAASNGDHLDGDVPVTRASLDELEDGSFHSSERHQTTWHERMDNLIMTPGSGKRMIWDCLLGMCLTTEAVLTPFTLCFRPEESFSGTLLRSCATVFWLCDLIINFFTGFNRDGELVKDPRAIALHYAQTWLSFDIFLITLDTVSLITAQSRAEGSGNENSWLKILRLFRAVRLLRVFKMKRILQDMTRNIQSDSVLLCGAIGFRCCLIFFTTHIMACGWYLCATFTDSKDHWNWVRAHHLEDTSTLNKYMTSLHWAISQVHGAMEVSPQNTLERTYAVIGLLVSLFVMAGLVGNFANLLANLWSSQNYMRRQLWLLRRYMEQLEVSEGVAKKVDTYVQYVLIKQVQEVSGDNIEVLKFLSKSLADELKADSYLKFAYRHALFAYICSQTGDCLVSIVESLSTSWMSKGDFAFMCGDTNMDMVLFMDGGGEYHHDGKELQDHTFQLMCDCGNVFMGDAIFCRKCGKRRQQEESEMPETLRAGSEENIDAVSTMKSGGSWTSQPTGPFLGQPEEVPKGQWIAEPVLWVRSWISLGDLEVSEACQLARINSIKFRTQVRHQRTLWEMMAAYATTFANTLSKTEAVVLSDLSESFARPEAMCHDCGLNGKKKRSAKLYHV